MKKANRSYYKLECDQIYSYKVYPRNNHAMPLAVSGKSFSTERNCQDAMQKLRQYILNGKIQIKDETLVKVEKTGDKSYAFSIYSSGNDCLLKSSKVYKTKKTCQDAVKRAFEIIQNSQ